MIRLSFVATLSLLLFRVAPAGAQEGVYGSGERLDCSRELTACDIDSDCNVEAGEICTYVGEARVKLCTHGIDSFLCCAGTGSGSDDADCQLVDPDTGGVLHMGVCLDAPDDPRAEGIDGLCHFGGLDEGTGTFCSPADELSYDGVVACMTTTSGDPTDNWAEGDCDGDDLPNQLEWEAGCDVCTFDPVLCSDEMPDGGLDGGPDSGPYDAAADSSPIDSSMDSGGGGGDVAVTNFRGAGGCACRSAGDAPLSLWPLALLVLFALFRSTRRAG